MYDDIPFNARQHLLDFQDVGLNGLYLMDCEALGDLATMLGHTDAAQEVRVRARSVPPRDGAAVG